MVGAGDGWVVSVGGVFSSRVAEAVAVSDRGGACVVESIVVSLCCDRSSVVWARVGDNSSGIDVTAVFFDDVAGKRLFGRVFGMTGA